MTCRLVTGAGFVRFLLLEHHKSISATSSSAINVQWGGRANSNNTIGKSATCLRLLAENVTSNLSVEAVHE